MIYSEEEAFPLTDSTSFSWGSHIKMPLYTGGALDARSLQVLLARF